MIKVLKIMSIYCEKTNGKQIKIYQESSQKSKYKQSSVLYFE